MPLEEGEWLEGEGELQVGGGAVDGLVVFHKVPVSVEEGDGLVPVCGRQRGRG